LPADPWASFADAPGHDPFAHFQDAPVQPTGPQRKTMLAHDGDTFPLPGGVPARLFGVDAPELNQNGFDRNGNPVPIGLQSRDFLRGQLAPGGFVFSPTGTQSYGRPVVSGDKNGTDLGRNVLDAGMGVAAPDYLKGDPVRLGSYMEAERLSRLNRRGAFATQFQDPAAFRHRDPWAPAETSPDGKGTAVFFDEPTPFQGLRPEIAQGYIALNKNPQSTVEDILNYAKANGFALDPAKVEKFVKARNSGTPVSYALHYEQLPQVLTNQGDGAVGAFGRGLADPVNMLDELGGVADTLGGTQGRENLWNSDRRFGDILWNNIDQNRSILAYDDANHPYARFGGQLVGGVAIPGASIEGVGLDAARVALRAGASRLAAVDAAKAAVRNRLAAVGAGEGAIAGFGAGEGGPVERAPNTLIGGLIGGGLGLTAGTVGTEGAPLVRKLLGRSPTEARSISEMAGLPVAPEEIAPEGALSALAGDAKPSALPDNIGSPVPQRIPDRIDVWSQFKDAEPSAAQPSVGIDQPSVGRLRPIGGPVSAEDIANLARKVEPGDVTPLPSNAIESLDEAVHANPGSIRDVQAPNERAVLQPYQLPGGPVRRDPLDLISWLRTRGGVQDQGGELSAMGITNNARDLDFAKSEGFLGKIVNPQGMTLDDAAQAAWERGYFPDHAERPTVPEFLDALGETHRGGPARVFHPDDYAAVDAFDAARSQRMAVEKAQAEGSPLAEQVGDPVELSDLDKTVPPVTAYEDLPKLGAKAGNIALDRLESPNDIRRALQSVEKTVGGFDAATRGKVSHAQTSALAREMGMTAEDLLKRRQGQALNAEQALAARAILAKSGDELVKLADRVKADGGNESLAAFREAWLKHVAIQEQVSGATAEAGRALSQFRITAKASDVQGRVLKALVDEGGGEDRLKEVAQAILDLRDPAKANQFLRQAIKPRFRDKLVELYYNSLLSGPQTHAVNILSNTLTSLAQIPEHAIASGIGQLRRSSEDRVLGSEIGARAVGLLQGVKEGLAEAARTMRTGEASDLTSKVEAQSHEAISGLKGKIIRTPTRALSAEDELFKAMARRMELAGLAVRKASSEGLKGTALKRRISSLMTAPTDDMLERAFDYGRYVTFQRPLGPVGQSVTKITNDWPLAKLILPFVRTPTNILKFAIERSPGAPLLKEWRADIAAGGARRDLAIAKATVGSAIGALITEWASKGIITGGGPADESAKRLEAADGWQPYSIKLGDKYYSYKRLDPFAITFGVAADMADLQSHMTEKQREDTASLLVASIMQSLSSRTWLSGLSDLTAVMNDPARYADAWYSRMAGSIVVPAVVAQTARTFDPTIREAKGPLERIESRIPGLSTNLQPMRDVFGRPIESEGGLGPNWMTPIYTSTAKNDPTIKGLLNVDAHISPPQRKIGNRALTPEEYGRYSETTGKIAKPMLDRLIGGPTWAGLDVEQKQDLVSDIMRQSRKEARDALFAPGGVPMPKKGTASDPWSQFKDAR